MPFKKLGELIDISPANVQAPEAVIPIIDPAVMDDFRKFASNLKRIAPKAEDFLYFSAVMMHAAEASLVNEDGSPKLTRTGEAVEAHWDKKGGTWKWVSSDPSVKPYKNSNGDIFPEEELVKAFKKWIGRPLCIDHKSSSVDHVRGFIVDTYYDRNLKRVIALCALDKHNYPELARKIATGYSNSVSMGTAVERAICYDCGTVARTEHDFCQHMRSKSCYGEINIGLNPIELSIVVNGADPAAKIKHIIAAAKNVDSYFELKGQEINKLAASSTNSDSLSRIKNDLDEAMDKLAKLEESLKDSEKDTNDTAFNQSSGTVAMDETDLPSTEYSNAPPQSRYASDKDLEQEFAAIKSSIEVKLTQMQKDLDKLANTFTNTKEEIMSGQKDNLNKQGYFLGGGDLNEPTPGQRKYPVDPTQDKLREEEDRQMVGQKPFPDVGPVDGLYPGYDSFPTGELERKKMLARAEAEERALRRTAVIQKAKDALETSKKEAYLQNGLEANNPNTPTPHKTKYKPDPQEYQLRDKEDRQMVGQKPFPDVGPVDGMHPSPESADVRDEKKRKEMLLRAGLRARFIKASNNDGTQNLGKSAWEVFLGDKLLLTKTVDEITNGHSDKLYAAIASEAFGKDLISKVKVLGADKVNSLFKVAQMPPPSPMGDAPPAPGGDMPSGDASPAGGPAEDAGKSGDPKDTILELAEKIRDLVSDLVEAARALTGEQAEMGDMEGGPAPAADDSSGEDSGKVSTAILNNMKKDLNGALTVAIKEAIAGLNDHEQELNTIAGLYEKGSITDANKDVIGSIVEDAVTEAKEAFADSFKLLGAFVKYARGTYAIEKRAEEDTVSAAQELNKQADEVNMANKEIMDLLGETGGELADLESALDASSAGASAEDAGLVSELLSDDMAAIEGDANNAIVTTDPSKAAELQKKFPESSIELKAVASSTKEERADLRTKLAADIKWNPVFYDFHPKGGAEPGPLDVKPSDKLEVVENLEETHDAMMDVATAPPNVRKAAEEIQKLVAEGSLDPKDLDLLVANGVDPAAVKYWKDFYGEVGPEGKEFATELVKEHVKAQLEAEMSQFRVKLARSYELAYEMVDRELLPRDRDAISAQVDEIMKWNDQGFESMKKVIARHAPTLQKSAGRMPQVGIDAVYGNASNGGGGDDLLSQLNEAFSTSKSKRMF